MSQIVAGGYVALGLVWMVTYRDIPQWYVAILLFMAFKVLFKYEKCTLSYIEVKVRGVTKEEGFIYRFLAGFQGLRRSPMIFGALAIYTLAITITYFFALGKSLVI